MGANSLSELGLLTKTDERGKRWVVLTELGLAVPVEEKIKKPEMEVKRVVVEDECPQIEGPTLVTVAVEASAAAVADWTR